MFTVTETCLLWLKHVYCDWNMLTVTETCLLWLKHVYCDWKMFSWELNTYSEIPAGGGNVVFRCSWFVDCQPYLYCKCAFNLVTERLVHMSTVLWVPTYSERITHLNKLPTWVLTARRWLQSEPIDWPRGHMIDLTQSCQRSNLDLLRVISLRAVIVTSSSSSVV
jgi:hypothetical protein